MSHNERMVNKETDWTYHWTFTFLSKVELTGTGFTFPLENNQNKSIQNLWNKGFQIPKHHTMKVSDLWEIGNKWAGPYNCLDLLPLQSFWAWHKERKPKQSLADSLIWGEEPESAGRPKQLQSSRWEYQRRELHKGKNSQTVQREPCVFSQVMISTCTEGNYPRLGERGGVLKRVRRNSAGAHKGMTIVPIPIKQMEKTHNSWGIE